MGNFPSNNNSTNVSTPEHMRNKFPSFVTRTLQQIHSKQQNYFTSVLALLELFLTVKILIEPWLVASVFFFLLDSATISFFPAIRFWCSYSNNFSSMASLHTWTTISMFCCWSWLMLGVISVNLHKHNFPDYKQDMDMKKLVTS